MAKQRIPAVHVEEDHDAGTLRMTALDAQGETTDHVVETSLADLPTGMRDAMALDGIKDHLLSARGNSRGEEAWQKMEKKLSALLSGKRTLSRGGVAKGTYLERALAALYSKDLSEVKAAVAEMSGEQVKQYKQHPQIAAEINRIRADDREVQADGEPLPALD